MKIHTYRGLQIQKRLHTWEILGKYIPNGLGYFTYYYHTLAAAKASIDRHIESGEWAEVA
jgi:hypothetical protein